MAPNSTKRMRKTSSDTPFGILKGNRRRCPLYLNIAPNFNLAVQKENHYAFNALSSPSIIYTFTYHCCISMALLVANMDHELVKALLLLVVVGNIFYGLYCIFTIGKRGRGLPPGRFQAKSLLECLNQ